MKTIEIHSNISNFLPDITETTRAIYRMSDINSGMCTSWGVLQNAYAVTPELPPEIFDESNSTTEPFSQDTDNNDVMYNAENSVKWPYAGSSGTMVVAKIAEDIIANFDTSSWADDSPQIDGSADTFFNVDDRIDEIYYEPSESPRCDQCRETFTSRELLSQHIKTHNLEDSDSTHTENNLPQFHSEESVCDVEVVKRGRGRPRGSHSSIKAVMKKPVRRIKKLNQKRNSGASSTEIKQEVYGPYCSTTEPVKKMLKMTIKNATTKATKAAEQQEMIAHKPFDFGIESRFIGDAPVIFHDAEDLLFSPGEQIPLRTTIPENGSFTVKVCFHGSNHKPVFACGRDPDNSSNSDVKHGKSDDPSFNLKAVDDSIVSISMGKETGHFVGVVDNRGLELKSLDIILAMHCRNNCYGRKVPGFDLILEWRKNGNVLSTRTIFFKVTSMSKRDYQNYCDRKNIEPLPEVGPRNQVKKADPMCVGPKIDPPDILLMGKWFSRISSDQLLGLLYLKRESEQADVKGDPMGTKQIKAAIAKSQFLQGISYIPE